MLKPQIIAVDWWLGPTYLLSASLSVNKCNACASPGQEGNPAIRKLRTTLHANIVSAETWINASGTQAGRQ